MPVRGEGGGEEPALVGGPTAIEWTRIGTPLGRRGALPERIRYRLEDGALLRERLAVADRAPGLAPERSRLLPGVAGLVFRFLDQEGRWRPDWPAEGRSGLPRAVAIELEIRGLGELRRVVAVGAQR
ncbi:MAG: type II secretion system protein GspJ [Xanthomonadales bacterium]|nr:type II secretion system protein GspJ [Xanthomonadales bacterium]